MLASQRLIRFSFLIGPMVRGLSRVAGDEEEPDLPEPEDFANGDSNEEKWGDVDLSDEALHARAINQGIRQLFSDRSFTIPVPGGIEIDVTLANFLDPEAHARIMAFDRGGAGDRVRQIPVESVYATIRGEVNKLFRSGKRNATPDDVYDISNDVVAYLLSESFFNEMERRVRNEVDDVVKHYGPLSLFPEDDVLRTELNRRYVSMIDRLVERVQSTITALLEQIPDLADKKKALEKIQSPESMLKSVSKHALAGYPNAVLEAVNAALLDSFKLQYAKSFGTSKDEVTDEAIKLFLRDFGKLLAVNLKQEIQERDSSNQISSSPTVYTSAHDALISTIIEFAPRYREFFERAETDPKRNLHLIYNLSGYFFNHLLNRVRNAFRSEYGRARSKDVPASTLEGADEENRDFSEIVGAAARIFDQNFQTLFSLFQHYLTGRKPDYVDQDPTHKRQHDLLWKKVVSKLGKPKGWEERNVKVFKYLMEGLNLKEIADRLADEGTSVTPGALSNNDLWKIRSAWINFIDSVIADPDGQQLIAGSSSDQTIRDVAERWRELLDKYGLTPDPRVQRILKSTSIKLNRLLRRRYARTNAKIAWLGYAVASFKLPTRSERYSAVPLPIIRLMAEAEK